LAAAARRRYGSLYFNGKCFKVKGEPSELLAFRGIGGLIADECAFCRIRANAFQLPLACPSSYSRQPRGY